MREKNLNDLEPGQKARVKTIDSKGSIRRRLLDIGLIEGTRVECLGRSPGGDPSAYRIRGAVIAIRGRDGRKIKVTGEEKGELLVALAGNPNVGKSTVFNSLTGQHQHTGNWPGKTVASARGRCRTGRNSYILVDIPGTYSLMAHSAEEEIARDFICFGGADAVVVVCDATCLERNLNLVLQVLEISDRVLVCVNLMDEAESRGIRIDLQKLEQRLGVPVVETVARERKTLGKLLKRLDRLAEETAMGRNEALEGSVLSAASCELCGSLQPVYACTIEQAAAILEPVLLEKCRGRINSRWLSMRMLEQDADLIGKAEAFLREPLLEDREVSEAYLEAQKCLREAGWDADRVKDALAEGLVQTAERVCRGVVAQDKRLTYERDRKLDRILTSRLTGYPVMLLLLAGVFWLTIRGADYPSALLAKVLFAGQEALTVLSVRIGVPDWLYGLLVLGGYRVLAWVVSVMLPPMAIFFPLFTLLEDAGYLPRVAYNLDRPFQRCRACGKQALTMCMGFGCNAAGVVGCRIIDSPRERLLAVLTNNFVPCNGRFPILIAVILMFFAGSRSGAAGSVAAAGLLTGVILLGIGMTFLTSWLLSRTILKGEPSAFTLELPPYRKPQIGKVLVRSILDRTLFVLGRAVVSAVPAGLILWVLANVTVNGRTLLAFCTGALDPLAMLFGLDGVILMAFLLGLPANEIVVPIIIMTYLGQGTLPDPGNLESLKGLLLANGWSPVTAVCTMLFTLMHWPCATTLLTIHRETRSLRWTALAFLLPTTVGLMCCFLVRLAAG